MVVWWWCGGGGVVVVWWWWCGGGVDDTLRRVDRRMSRQQRATDKCHHLPHVRRASREQEARNNHNEHAQFARASIIAQVQRQRSQLRDSDATVLVLSLVVAQMLVGVFVLPASIAGLFYDGSWLCKLHHYTALVSPVTSAASQVGLVIVTRK